MQVGYVGLLKAINGFDPAVGDSLSAYAAPCIAVAVKRHFRDKRWQVHVRRPVQELLLEMRRRPRPGPGARLPLRRRPGRCPRVTEDEIREACRASLAFSASSLDAPLTGPRRRRASRRRARRGRQAFEHAIDMDAVQAHLDELPEREQRALVLRFYGNLTQAEIGQRLGISQMHVSRLLTRALAYLRDKLTSDPGDNTMRPPGLGSV